MSCVAKSPGCGEATRGCNGCPALLPVMYLEQAAMAGVLAPDALGQPERGAGAGGAAGRGNAPTERGWVVTPNASGVTLGRTVRGVAERYTLDAGGAAQRRGALAGRARAHLANMFGAPRR